MWMIIVGKNLHFAVMKGEKIQLNNTDYPQKGSSVKAGLQRKTTRTTIPSCFVSGHWTELFFTRFYGKVLQTAPTESAVQPVSEKGHW